jgi:hypothetical protein
MTEYDRWLDKDLDEFYEDSEDFYNSIFPDEPEVEPSNDYDNYDGWDDMQ